MPSTTDYYNTLKLQLENQAANKKLALDLAYERATTVEFDSSGNMTRKKNKDNTEKGPGTLDVQYAEQQRQMSGAAESSGMLRSGERSRDLATSLAGYRSAVVAGAAETTAAKTAIEDETTTELAKYQAMYGTPAATTGGGTGGGGGGTSSAPKDEIGPAPEFKPPPSAQLKQTTSRVTKKTPIARTAAPAKKAVPKVPAPRRIGGL